MNNQKVQEVGRFQAISFDGRSYEFIVYDNNTINCISLALKIYNIKKVILKPRFGYCSSTSYHEIKIDSKNRDGVSQLICNYIIYLKLFNYLKKHNMISYSTDMAYLYNFPDKSGYDSDWHCKGTPFKRARKKGPILVKQKIGMFN